jgi:hypothetical protein
MKTKQDFIKHLINNYYIQRYVKNEKVYFEIFSEKYKYYIEGKFLNGYPSVIVNTFDTHPDFKDLYLYEIICSLVNNKKIENYTHYELTQNC